MDNKALYANCKRFCELSELDPDKWTSPIQAEYQELLSKLQSGHSIVINNGDRNSDSVDAEMVEAIVEDLVRPALSQLNGKISDIEVFLAERIGYQSKGHTF